MTNLRLERLSAFVAKAFGDWHYGFELCLCIGFSFVCAVLPTWIALAIVCACASALGLTSLNEHHVYDLGVVVGVVVFFPVILARVIRSVPGRASE